MIVEAIASHNFPCVVTVTTPTAKSLYPHHSKIRVRVGKLDTVAIRQFCIRETINGIIDASHPFALTISQQVMNVAQSLSIPYLRYERPSLNHNPQTIYLDSFDELITGNYLRNQRVLLTVGCRALSKFKLWHQQSVLYARILPKLESLEIALKAGFSEDKLILLRPPITLELEKALWQQWKINLVVTKASGKQGGENIKRQVANALEIPLITIKRTSLNYPQQTEHLSDIIKFCHQCFQA